MNNKSLIYLNDFIFKFNENIINLNDKDFINKLKELDIEEISNIKRFNFENNIENISLKFNIILEINSIKNISKGIKENNIFSNDCTLSIEFKNKFLDDTIIIATNLGKININYKNLDDIKKYKILFKKNTKIKKLNNRFILLFYMKDFEIIDDTFNLKKIKSKDFD